MKNTSRLTITEAIALSGISRSQFYSKYINKGLISKSKDNQGKMCIDKSELLRVFPDIKTVEESTDSYSKVNVLKQQCVLLELENRYLKEQIEHHKLLEQKAFEREKGLQSTINHYQQSLPNPDKKHKSDKKKRKKTKKNKR